MALSHTKEKPDGEKEEMSEKHQHRLQTKLETSVQFNPM
jgi:hypothetical protein